MEDVLAAERRYFDSGATRPLRFRREMLTRLELALTRWEGELLEALKADLNKSPYEGSWAPPWRSCALPAGI